MLKKILILLIACSIFILPLHATIAQDTCCADQEACESLLNEEMNRCESLIDALEISDTECTDLLDTINDLKADLNTCEKSNDNDGDVSIADLLKYIPGFNKLTGKQRATIITIILGLTALGLSYIPPPSK